MRYIIVDKIEVPNRLKQIRIKNHLTQRQMAERLGVSKSIINYYETGSRTPSIDILIRISTTFHISTDYLLGLDKTRTLDVSGLSDDDVNVVQGVIDALRRKN